MDRQKFSALLDFPSASPRLCERAAGFARGIHEAWPDMAGTYPLPAFVRQRAAEAGVTGIGIDEAHGGQGGGYEDISACAAQISFWSGSPGLALSLFIHQLSARFAMGTLASLAQREEFLPQLAAGGLTVANAVSEPETGGNPKGMKTRAQKDGNHWVLSGNKAFVTNGPLAGLLLTLAVSGEKNGRKEFSAFLVPAGSQGVEVRDVGPFPFLRPAPHGAVGFNEVKLSESALLGEEGKALAFFSRTFVALEDALMPGLLAGGYAALFHGLCRDIVTDGIITAEQQRLAGRLQAALIAFAGLAAYAAARTNAPDFVPKSQGLSRGIRELSQLILSLCRDLARDVPLAPGTEILFADLEGVGKIRGRLAGIQEEKAGREMFSM